MSLENIRYDAFISYRHCELDSFISENLHKKLENYKMPASVIKKLAPRKTKIERVFRDEAELPLSNNLSDPISEALDNSEFLIVICTPRLPQSQWCRKEIETFVETHDRKHVLLVLAEGEPEESFPDILMYEDVVVKDENGRDVTVRMDREPLAADCRGDNNRQRLKALDNVVLKLCAAMFNLNYDDLKQRHRERQVRNRLVVMSTIMAIVTAFAITCLAFTVKISRQNRIIQDKYAGAMASASTDLLAQGLTKEAAYAVREVLPDHGAEGFNADAYRALSAAMAVYETENCYFPRNDIRVPLDLRGISISEDGAYVLVNCFDHSALTDTATGEVVVTVDDGYAAADDTGVIWHDSANRIIHTDRQSGEEAVMAPEGYELFGSPGVGTTLVFTSEGIAGYTGTKESFLIDYDDLGIDGTDYSVDDHYFTPDGKYAAFAVSMIDGTQIAVIDLLAGKPVKSLSMEALEEPVVATDGSRVYVCFEEEGFGDEPSVTYMVKADLAAGDELTSVTLAGTGFYEMRAGDNGIIVISDRLAYIMDEDLGYMSSITGFGEAVCCFEQEEGYVIVDERGKMFCDGVVSNVGRIYRLYGNESGAMITHAIYSGGDLYVKYVDSDRIVIYSPGEDVYEAMGDTGDADDFDPNPEGQVDISGLEGIDDISVSFAGITADGRYTAVQADDGVLYIYDSKSKKTLKEVYDPGIVMSHKRFPYLKGAGVYLIENAVIDENLNYISKLPNGEIAATGKDEKSIVLISPYDFDTYYRIEILPYDEMIKAADEMLGSFIPDRRICERYSIGQPAGE